MAFDSTLLGLSTIPSVWLYVIVVWSLVWKGLALWKSSRRNQKVWFVVMLVLNTVGILEILYIFVFSKMGPRSRGPQIVKTKRSTRKATRPKRRKKK